MAKSSVFLCKKKKKQLARVHWLEGDLRYIPHVVTSVLYLLLEAFMSERETEGLRAKESLIFIYFRCCGW